MITKRLCSIFLLSVLIFSSCGKNESNGSTLISPVEKENNSQAITGGTLPTPDNTDDVPGVVPTQKSEKDIEADMELARRLSEKDSISWVYENNGIVNLSKSQEFEFNKRLDELGIDVCVSFSSLPVADYVNGVNGMIESGNYPDLLFTGSGDENSKIKGTERAVYYDWLEDITDYIGSEEAAKLKDSLPDKILKASSYNGRYYGISGMLPYFSNLTYYVNKELMDKYGRTEDDFKGKSFSELEPILDKVSSEENCTVIVPFRGEIGDAVVGVQKIYSSDGIISELIGTAAEEPDKICNLLKSKGVRDYIISLNRYNSKYSTNGENFFVFFDCDDISTDISNDKINQIKREYGEHEIVAISAGPFCMPTQKNGITGVCKYSKNKERALQVLTYAMSDAELSEILLYGVEGENYVMNDGKAEVPNITWYKALDFGNRFLTSQAVFEPDNKEEVFRKVYEEMPETCLLGVYFDLSSCQKEVDCINQIYRDYKTLFSGKSENPEKELTEMISKLEDAGINRVVEEANRQIQDFDNNDHY